MTLTVQALEAVEKAATEDLGEDLTKAEKGRLMTLLRSAAAVRADITVAEIRAKSQLTLESLAKK